MQDLPADKPVLKDAFDKALELVDSDAGLCVAFSGGRDSTVLLDLVARISGRKVRALHVNHGLHPDAGDWAQHCHDFCRQRGLAIEVLQVEVDTAHPQGLEAAAREARYKALHANIGPAEVLLTAHHAQDQLETYLLQLLRGAGTAGLAAMPIIQMRQGVTHLRPLLHAQVEAVADYASGYKLEWMEDPSNVEHQFDRNYLRHKVVPLILQRWPSAARSVSRAARHSGTATALLSELAARDLEGLVGDKWVSCDALRALSSARQANAIRHCLRKWELPVPSEVRLNQVLSDLLSAGDDRLPEGSWPGVRARRFRERLWFFNEVDDPVQSTAGAPKSYDWSSDKALDMGVVRGVLEVDEASHGGIAGKWLDASLQVRFRTGGESLRPADKAATRKLKKLLQESDIFPWMRCHIPLIYHGEKLVAVGDLWVDAAFLADEDEAGYRINWRDHAPISTPSAL